MHVTATRILIVGILSLTAGFACWPTAVQAEIQPDFVMLQDPEFKLPPSGRMFHSGMLPLWLEALQRPEADYQRLAAETLALAQEEGVPGVEKARPHLLKVLQAEGSHPAARFAAARALVAIKAQDAAPALLKVSQKQDSALRQLIEPALAEWKFAPAQEVWRRRIADRKTPRRDLVLAIRCAGEAGDAEVVKDLLSIVHETARAADIRLAAAKSAGALQSQGLEVHADRLMHAPQASILQRLCAVILLQQHSSTAAQQLLLQLAGDSQPAIIAPALLRLFEIDPALPLPLAETAMQNADSVVRSRGAAPYIALPNPERVAVLSKLLDDVHPGVRGEIRDALFKLAQQPELKDAVILGCTTMLAQDSWRGQEQAALVLAALDHKPAVQRLVELLESPRPEVMVATAWGLRKLAVTDTLPAIFDKASRQTQLRTSKVINDPAVDHQVAHLFEALGKMKYAPAEPMLMLYVPKSMTMGEFSRGAAIWSLGQLHAGVPDEALAKTLADRVTDPQTPPPEMTLVRLTSAVAIGRMGAVSQASRLKAWVGPKIDANPAELAVRWALIELTGETMPEPDPMFFGRAGWFLEPLDEDPALNAKSENTAEQIPMP